MEIKFKEWGPNAPKETSCNYGEDHIFKDFVLDYSDFPGQTSHDLACTGAVIHSCMHQLRHSLLDRPFAYTYQTKWDFILFAMSREMYFRNKGATNNRHYTTKFTAREVRLLAYRQLIEDMKNVLKDEDLTMRQAVMAEVADMCQHRSLFGSFLRAFRVDSIKKLASIVTNSLKFLPKSEVRGVVAVQLVTKRLGD